MPVVNPDSGYPARKFLFAGRIDEQVDGRVIDYKSTGDPRRFIDEKSIGFQVDLYRLAAGGAIHECEYRLITVPGIKLCGKDASPEAYEQRCLEWLRDPAYPDRLMSHPIPVNPAREKTTKQYLWDCCQRVLSCRKTGCWLTNENACYCWNKRCAFYPLCQACAEGNDVWWIIDGDYETCSPHPELGDTAVRSGKTVITYTACSTLTLCEMKYYWRYEKCIRRKRLYEDAPWLGSAMHAGIEAFRAGGYDAAVAAIDAWAEANPAFGEEAVAVQQQKHKARAMARAACEKWSG